MDFSPLTTFMDSLIERGIPGCDIIIQQDHKTLFRYMTGCRDREAGLKMRGDEMYFMYSVSKPVTVTAALQLLEKGLFLLTDPVSDYLPEYRDLTVRQADGSVRPAAQPMLIRHLFSMTAGLDYDLNKPEIRRALDEKGDRCTTRDIVRAIASSPLVFEPGTHWNYSLCHDVLAGLVEVVSGIRFADYVRKNIFEPLGMSKSAYHRAPDSDQDYAALYIYDDEQRAARRLPLKCDYIFSDLYDSGGAGMVSCVDDYALFADALACGGVGRSGARILGQPAIDLMRENQLGPAQMADFNWVQLTGYGYGLGVRTAISRAPGGLLGPVGEFGWSGAAGAYLMLDPERRLSVYYGQHMRNSMEPYVHPRIRNIVYSVLARG